MAHLEEAPPVDAAAPPPPPEVAASRPRTYRELYADSASQPEAARLVGYLSGYRFAGEDEIRSSAQLKDQTIAVSDRRPMAFLCLVS